MNIAMFSSWGVRCGIADPHAREIHARLNELPDTKLDVVPFDRMPHPRSDYVAWGRQMNTADIAHIQFDYSFFDYLLPWRQKFSALRNEISRPLVITRHVSFDGKLHLHGHGPAALARRLKWRLYQHPTNPYATFLNKTIFAGANHVIVLTQRLRDQLLRRGLPADHVTVIPAGVKAFIPAAPHERDDVRARLGWHGKRIVGQFGFIAPPKAHALMLEALVHLPDDHVFLIAGGVRLAEHKHMLDALEARIAALNLRKRVHITGFLEEADIARHVAACDVLVFPYTHADFSQSVADALAFAHCKVIASDIDGHREIQQYCPALQVFKAGDAQALSREIQTVETPALLSQRAAQMRKYRDEFSWHSIAQRTRNIYAKVLSDGA